MLASFAALAWGAVPAQAVTQTFVITGGEQTFVVPAGVTSLNVVAIGGYGGNGAGSGSYIGGLGGASAKVSGSLPVSPGQTLYVEVGDDGASGAGGAGGFNGGGQGGGGGGGASDVRTVPLAAGLGLDTRLIVAGAGGGGGDSAGSQDGGDGGDAESDGFSGAWPGGGAGTQVGGGLGGDGYQGANGQDGQLGQGGAGGNHAGRGGGGAGGFYGGGGGGASGSVSAGGGGGSSKVPAGGSVGLAAVSELPKVEISYALPSSPAPQGQAQPVADNSSPTLASFSKSSRLSRGGAISFQIQTNENAIATASATVNVPASAKILRFKSRNLVLSGNVKTKVTLKLSRRNAAKVRRALRRKRRLAVKVNVALKDTAGNAGAVRLNLALTR
ncbi:MAG: glycine-rich protein [Solirubrobacterales bacterium]